MSLPGPASSGSAEPLALLHRLDGLAGDVAVAVTDRARLRAVSFLDGREPFWSALRVSSLELAGPGERPARRFVFHVGFCGSTLLARLLDRPGRVLVLKEPQCLADIAGQRDLIARGQGVAGLGEILDHAIGRLGEAAEPDGVAVVKPTNWVNPLLGTLCTSGRVERALFMSMAPRAYLGAVFRGGRARIEFCTRLAAEVAAVLPEGNAWLTEAIATGGDPLERAARIVALLHRLQERLFEAAIAANGWPSEARLDFEAFVNDPAASLALARRVLELPLEGKQPAVPAATMRRHAKDPASAFDAEARKREDAEIERLYARPFDAALRWLDGVFPA